METTQTGMAITDCGACGGHHPVGRRHCAGCGRPSLFINPAGACLLCAPAAATSADARDSHGCFCPGDCGCNRTARGAAPCGCAAVKHAAATSARCGAPYCVLELEHVGGHRVAAQVLAATSGAM